MEKVKEDLINLIDKLYLSEKIDKSSDESKALKGLKKDLTTGINAHTFRPDRKESIRGITNSDMPLYALKIISNAFLLGINISDYTSDFNVILNKLKDLHLEQDEEVYGLNANETIQQNHERTMSAFKLCSSIISTKGINATFTGSLSLYNKLGIESTRQHSDLDFYIEENNIYKFLKGLQQSGTKFAFKDERLCQREGSFDSESGQIKALNGGIGGGHKCQVNLIDPNAPKGYTEVGFFLNRQVKTKMGLKPRFIRYYLDRSNGFEKPIAVSQQMQENVSMEIDVPLDDGTTVQVKGHSFEFCLRFKMNSPKSRTKDVEDALMFTQNADLQKFKFLLKENKLIDKSYYLESGNLDNYPAINVSGDVIDNMSPEEKVVDRIFSTAENIIALKNSLSTANEEDSLAINEQILSLQNTMRNEYTLISTESLISGINSKMQIYDERFSMAMSLDGLPRTEPLTNENLEDFEHEYEQKQLANEEVIKTLGLSQIKVESEALSNFVDE